MPGSLFSCLFLAFFPHPTAPHPTPPMLAPHPSPQERLPWEPLLTDEEVQRAEAYYGTGRRMRQVAAKLLAGQPIQVRGGTVLCCAARAAPPGGSQARCCAVLQT